MWQEMVDTVAGDSTVQGGDASQDRNSSSTVRLRRRSRTPQRCGGPGQFQVSGLMSVAS